MGLLRLRLGLLVFSILNIFVFAGCGGGSAGGVETAPPPPVSNLIPQLSSISPSSINAGSGALTVTATGQNFVSTSQVEWNNAPLPTTYVSGSQLTAQIPAADLAAASEDRISVSSPSPGGGNSASQQFSVLSNTTRVTVLPVNANDIVWDGTRARIYASLPSNDSSNGNSVAVIDPVAGTITSTVPVAGDPDRLALSSDASYLWVGQDGTGSVQRFDLHSFTPDLSFSIPDTEPGAQVQIQAAPVNPHTAAVMAWVLVDGYYTPISYVYDDGSPRSNTLRGPNYIQWGATDSNLYGEDSIKGFFIVTSVNSTGPTILSEYPGVVSHLLNGGNFDQPSGHIFLDNGQVLNPATGDLVGVANIRGALTINGGPCLPDASQNVLFCVSGAGPYQLQGFDKTTLRPLNTIDIPITESASADVPIQLIRWGNAGLAFITSPVTPSTDPGSIFLIDGSFVSNAAAPDSTNGTGLQPDAALESISPQSSPAGSDDLILTINGSGFVPGATVYWDAFLGSAADWAPLDTTYVSSTQLHAVIPVANLALPGYASVAVMNQIPLANGAYLPLENAPPNDVAGFTITESSGGQIALSLASHDVAWDPNSGLLYAAVTSYDPQYPNSIVEIDPATGQVVKSQIVGSDPYLVRTTADGSYLYTAYLSSNSMTQLSLPDLGSPLTWSLRVNSSDYPWIALDIQPALGAPQTTAVSLGLAGSSPLGLGGITVFDDNIARPARVNGWGGSFGADYVSLQWGAGGSTLYGADETDLHTLTVNSSGVASLGKDFQLYDTTTNSTALNTFIHYNANTGDLYDDAGQEVNPANGEILGNFNGAGLELDSVPGLVAVDASLNRIFMLGQTPAQFTAQSGFTIESFDATTLAPIDSITVPNIAGLPESFIRWGASGLALTTYIRNTSEYPGGMLYIFNYPDFVEASESQVKGERGFEPLRLRLATPAAPYESVQVPSKSH